MTKSPLLAAALLAIGMEFGEADPPHPYVGMWVTADNHVRHELLPNGRYIEARGARERAYEGRYEVTRIGGTLPARSPLPGGPCHNG